MSFLSIITSLLYVFCAVLFFLRLLNKPIGAFNKKSILMSIGVIGSVLHFYILTQVMNTPLGIDISIFSILSLTSWLILSLLLLAMLRYPVENLAIIIMPLAAFFIILRYISPHHFYLNDTLSPGLISHILLSILSYSLLSIAAVQAILLYIQERHIRNRHPGGFVRALPPLETMETLLFHMITIGFLLLSVSLLTGIFYLDNIFEQHLVHKTLLSILGWITFAILLWGRHQFGWRGRTAIKWTISGFVLLMLAYFGSNFVMQLILK
ncbi:MAG: inner membrane protein YpjD [Gammaproteobacteria bacterium]